MSRKSTLGCSPELTKENSSIQPNSKNLPKMLISEIDTQLEADLLSFDFNQVLRKESSEVVTKQQSIKIVEKISKIKDFHYRSALGTGTVIFRKGVCLFLGNQSKN